MMRNSAIGIQREIKVKGQKLGIGTSFKYLGQLSYKDCTSHLSSNKVEADLADNNCFLDQR